MEDEQAVEMTDQEQDAAFEAGRQAARGDSPAVDDQVEQGSEEQQQDEAGADASADEPVLIAGLTESELKVVLAKANELDALKEKFGGETQKIYGKFGELQREIKKLSEGKPSGFTRESLKRLGEEYPEIADTLAEDLAGLTFGGSSSFDPTELTQQMKASLDGEVAALTRNFEVKLLTLKHPDWREKRATPEYQLWYGTLPPEKQAEIYTSTDGLFAAKALDEFDSWRNKGTRQKTNRLERAITPTGAPPEPSRNKLSDEAAFEAGRKEARKARGILR